MLDMLSVGYQFIGRPIPTKPVAMPVTDGCLVKNYTLARGEPWDFPFDSTKVKTIRYYKMTSKDDQATKLKRWEVKDRFR